MQKAPYPIDEAKRLAALRRLHLLDTPPEERFDRLTRLTCRLLDVPVCLVSLVDEQRQWFKSCVGLSFSETPRDVSFCGHAILGDSLFIVEDAADDPRFADSPLVMGEPRVRFYAGCPLTLANGYRVGTLCVMDFLPRQLDAEKCKDLEDMAHLAVSELEAIQVATIDPLTGLCNRRGFHRLARQAIAKCGRLRQDASLLYFDLDHFKEINDRFGHHEGDQALQAFALIINKVLREYDVIARLGGDEFAALVSHGHQQSAAFGIQARLKQAMAEHNMAEARGYHLSCSLGIANFQFREPKTVEDLLREADAHMYREKQARGLQFQEG
ncbi:MULTISPECIES: sensor domain-containing diguanylate cyclase [Shewanella]|uniref:Sensor domain-containing diguanylate cyclase n=2 Tax=Shewanella TaxID=22 RepID=A0A974XNB7_9GAMM|nr:MULTISPECIES: sensor domain-containing diguanylate cyclase [Shewanella]QSX31514.1 sensor domain-containing diguanylate cyclase [Shewanella cyperi]QSX38736.1 sensor domain-containing diguanylate cyclase [Shewanella sedimentimangrovi]QSX42294.1 sensor domain-containing diguanylate cyclase [Shewanella cyperi]